MIFPILDLFLISFPIFLAAHADALHQLSTRPRLKLALAEIRDDGAGSDVACYVRVEAENHSRRVAQKCTASLQRVERLGSSGPREYSLPLDWTDIGEATMDIGPGETERSRRGQGPQERQQIHALFAQEARLDSSKTCRRATTPSPSSPRPPGGRPRP